MKAIPHSTEPKLRRSLSDTMTKVKSYENSMQAWTDGRLPHLKRCPDRHHGWVNQRCQSQCMSPGGSPRTLGPELAEASFMGQTISSTASAPVAMETRRAHGYFEPGPLRRGGAKANGPGGWAVNVERMPREDRFICPRQPHDPEVMRSTVRETRFLPATMGHSVDVRRSN